MYVERPSWVGNSVKSVIKKQDKSSTLSAKTVWSSLPLFPVRRDSMRSASSTQNAKRPLAVRRDTPRVPKLRMADPSSKGAAGIRSVAYTKEKRSQNRERVPRRNRTTASFASRLLAGILDIVLFVFVDAVVVTLTASIAGTSLVVATELPMAPLLAFLFLFDFGSVIVLTAVAGQTIGKMIVGIRVVGSEGGPLTIGQVIARTIIFGLSVLPVGVGLVGLFVGSRRAFHDRLARTEVVIVAPH